MRKLCRSLRLRRLILSECSGNAHVLKPFNENFGITSNNKWTIALSIFYVGYCESSVRASAFDVKPLMLP